MLSLSRFSSGKCGSPIGQSAVCRQSMSRTCCSRNHLLPLPSCVYMCVCLHRARAAQVRPEFSGVFFVGLLLCLLRVPPTPGLDTSPRGTDPHTAPAATRSCGRRRRHRRFRRPLGSHPHTAPAAARKKRKRRRSVVIVTVTVAATTRCRRCAAAPRAFPARARATLDERRTSSPWSS